MIAIVAALVIAPTVASSAPTEHLRVLVKTGGAYQRFAVSATSRVSIIDERLVGPGRTTPFEVDGSKFELVPRAVAQAELKNALGPGCAGILGLDFLDRVQVGWDGVARHAEVWVRTPPAWLGSLDNWTTVHMHRDSGGLLTVPLTLSSGGEDLIFSTTFTHVTVIPKIAVEGTVIRNDEDGSTWTFVKDPVLAGLHRGPNLIRTIEGIPAVGAAEEVRGFVGIYGLSSSFGILDTKSGLLRVPSAKGDLFDLIQLIFRIPLKAKGKTFTLEKSRFGTTQLSELTGLEIKEFGGIKAENALARLAAGDRATWTGMLDITGQPYDLTFKSSLGLDVMHVEVPRN